MQNATIYKDGNHMVAKDFSFKIQSVSKDSKDERKTLGKVKVDMAEFCTGQVDPQPQDVFLQLKPHGKLKVRVDTKMHENLVLCTSSSHPLLLSLDAIQLPHTCTHSPTCPIACCNKYSGPEGLMPA